MRRTFEEPVADIIQLDANIITASNACGGTTDDNELPQLGA